MELRFLKIFILGSTIFLALKEFHLTHSHSYTNYLDGWLIGLLVSVLAGLASGGITYYFLENIRPDIGVVVEESLSFGKLSLSTLPAIVFIEDLFAGILASFVGMQYFKNTRNVGHRFTE